MGMLVHGRWVDDDAEHRTSGDGAFIWPDPAFEGWVSADGASGFAAEPGRYHIFAAPACPWAHRTLIVRRLKGLEDIISVSMADLPTRRSWAYSRGLDHGLAPADGIFELHQAYAAAKPDYVRENLAVGDLDLPQDALAELDAISSAGTAGGHD